MACIIWLWRKADSAKKKVYWSFIAAIPLIGPIFLGAFYDPPSPLPPHLQNRNELDVIPRDYGWRDVHDDDD